MMNKIILIGRLTKDAEVRYTTSNRACASFNIAVNRTYTNQEGQREADFINIVAWDKLGENVSKYTHKGSLVAVEGRLQVRSYENQEGRRIYVTEVVASTVQFLDSKEKTEQKTNENKNDPFEKFGQKINNDLPDIPESELPF
ncbi:MAG: single-stranded DNA-binding protein [Bacilli bacterium]|nr:single-stranded DNA-binding protein [Bacilli bacterium]